MAEAQPNTLHPIRSRGRDSTSPDAGGETAAARRARGRRRKPATTIGPAQTLLTYCSEGGACSLCRDDRATLTRLRY